MASCWFPCLQMASFWFLYPLIFFSRHSRISFIMFGLQHIVGRMPCVLPDAASSSAGHNQVDKQTLMGPGGRRQVYLASCWKLQKDKHCAHDREPTTQCTTQPASKQSPPNTGAPSPDQWRYASRNQSSLRNVSCRHGADRQAMDIQHFL